MKAYECDYCDATVDAGSPELLRGWVKFGVVGESGALGRTLYACIQCKLAFPALPDLPANDVLVLDMVEMEVTQEEALLIKNHRKNPGPSLLERIGRAVTPLTWPSLGLFACPLCLQSTKDMEGDWHKEDCLIRERDQAQNVREKS